MPDETKCSGAAYGIGNLAFYRMCGEFPSHSEKGKVADKLKFIARVYSVSRGLGGKWEELSSTIVENNSTFDEKIFAARRRPFLQNLDAILDCHAYLDELVCRILNQSYKTDKQALGRASFASKYLHFHAPDSFPILDTLASSGLAELTPKFRYPSSETKPYPRFCHRLSHYLRISKKEAISLRHIDTELVNRGKQKADNRSKDMA